MEVQLAAGPGLAMAVFGILALAFAGAGFAAYRLISYKQPKGGYGTTAYECGEEPAGPSHGIFQPRYYVVALIFLLFEVELAFLFPWAAGGFVLSPIENASTLDMPMLAFYEGLLFIALLALALVFAWAKGMLNWAMPEAPKPVSKVDAGEKYRQAFPGGKHTGNPVGRPSETAA